MQRLPSTISSGGIMQEAPTSEHSDRGDWPYASLLLFGFFGPDTPGGMRLMWRTIAALVVIVAAWVTFPLLTPGPFRVAVVLMIPGAVAGIFWAYVRYLGALDELSRTIQLRAFAGSYGAAMVIAAGVVAFNVAIPAEAARATHPVVYLMPLALAEIFRGLALVVFARKYR